MADSKGRNSEIERLILHPTPHVDLDKISPKFWDQVAALSDVNVVEMARIMFVMLAKRIEGENADSYSPELQVQAVRHVLDLFKESIQ